MLSILFAISTIDDMQDVASDMLRFLLSIKKWSKFDQKTYFLAHFVSFFFMPSYTL